MRWSEQDPSAVLSDRENGQILPYLGNKHDGRLRPGVIMYRSGCRRALGVSPLSRRAPECFWWISAGFRVGMPFLATTQHRDNVETYAGIIGTAAIRPPT